jgi:transcriptional regulator of heat shock response
MLTNRQEKLLNFLVKEYIDTAEPVGSLALKKVCDLDVSGATIRNDLQVLTEGGYITQPHTSAGRIPTKKAYKYFADKFEAKETGEEIEDFIVPACRQAGDKFLLCDFIEQQVELAHRQMAQEMQEMQELMQKLDEDNIFEKLTILEIWKKKL